MPPATQGDGHLVRVAVETGRKRTFVSAVDWPGWARGGRTETEALEVLASYLLRYRSVALAAAQPFDEEVGVLTDRGGAAFSVFARVEGNATTDFGAPAVVLESDRALLDPADLDRGVSLLRASWALLADVVARAPAQLRKGPRGGGRDRDAIAEHVLAAEIAYGAKLGLAREKVTAADTEATGLFRSRLLDAVRDRSAGRDTVPAAWPVRYALRRLIWHALDHCWEIEDKGELGPGAAAG